MLTNLTSYAFHIAIPNNPFTYKCDYHYSLNSTPERSNIFMFNSPQKPLLPVLQRPVDNSNFKVSYNPGNPSPNVKSCMVQVNAIAPNGTVNGNNTSQNGTTYSGGVGVGGLMGLGNIMMTRVCTPVYFNHNNSANDHSSIFDLVNVTFTSTASYEVSWV